MPDKTPKKQNEGARLGAELCAPYQGHWRSGGLPGKPSYPYAILDKKCIKGLS